MLCFVILSCAFALQVSGIQDSNAYKAAVVEFNTDQTSDDRVQNNLNGFEKIVKRIESDTEGVDIVLFPEYAITGFAKFETRSDIAPFLEEIPTPSPDDVINPCGDDNFKESLIFRNLSCLAKEYSIVIIANMGEKDGQYQYNTNVVFEKNGNFIAKYRKIHLYGIEEKFLDRGPDTCVTFTTSFGVEFGTFICFDILYENPGKCLLDKGIKNIAFTTAWGNSFPLYISVAFQQGWSLKHRVNLLAANYHYPIFRGTGSGLYSAGYAVQYVVNGTNDTPSSVSNGSYYVYELLKDPSENPVLKQTGYFSDVDKIIASSSSYAEFQLLSKQTDTVSFTNSSTVGEITCELKYTIMTVNPDEYYALGAYIGKRPDGKQKYSFCTVVKCNRDFAKNSGCGYLDNHLTETEFTTFELSGNFPDESTVYATVLGDKLQLLSPSEMEVGPKSLSLTNAKILSATLWIGEEISLHDLAKDEL